VSEIFVSRGSEFNERAEATDALLVHRADSAVLVTRHPVVRDKRGARLGAGTLFGVNDQAWLLELLADTDDSDILPENVLGKSARQLTWLVPGKVRPMLFRLSGRSQALRVPWPTLVFQATERSLRVVALKSSRRPQRDTPVFHAPLMNFYYDTRMCFGGAGIPQSLGVSSMPKWEAAVFDTAFSHTNHGRTLVRRDDDSDDNAFHFGFWRGLHKQKAARFPVRALVPTGDRLGDWMRLQMD